MTEPAPGAPGTGDADALAEIRRVFAEQLGCAREVRPADDLVLDLQLDSLGLLTLVVDLEDRFRICLDEQDAPAVRTVADLAALVSRRRAEQGAGA